MNRKAFNFYNSYAEVMSDLDDKQLVLFTRAMIDVQFLRVHIDSISFEDKILSITWKSVKHSIKQQLDGFVGAKKNDYNSLFDDIKQPLEVAIEVPSQGGKEVAIEVPSPQEKGEGQVKGQVQVKEPTPMVKEFTFTLDTKKYFDKLSNEYVSKLQEYILNKKDAELSFQDFMDGCLAGGYKYKNFSLAYNNWNKNQNPKRNKGVSNLAANISTANEWINEQEQEVVEATLIGY